MFAGFYSEFSSKKTGTAVIQASKLVKCRIPELYPQSKKRIVIKHRGIKLFQGIKILSP